MVGMVSVVVGFGCLLSVRVGCGESVKKLLGKFVAEMLGCISFFLFFIFLFCQGFCGVAVFGGLG